MTYIDSTAAPPTKMTVGNLLNDLRYLIEMGANITPDTPFAF